MVRDRIKRASFYFSCFAFAALVPLSTSQAARPFSCDYAFDILIEKVEDNYAGYPLADSQHIELVKAQVFEQIDNIQTQNCLPLLNEWLSVFEDPNLTISSVDDDHDSSKSKPQTVAANISWLSGSVALVSLSSFATEQRDHFDQLIVKNQSKLSQSEGIIVDLRGNQSGDFSELGPMLSLLGLSQYKSRWHVLASYDNLNYYLSLLSEPFIQSDAQMHQALNALVKSMTAYPNTWVEWVWPWRTHDIELTNLKQIYILQNAEVSHVAEEFLIAAKQHPNVVTFGEATSGKLDYLYPISHQILKRYVVNIPSQKRVWYEANPINNIGIKPDVMIDPNQDRIVDTLHSMLLSKECCVHIR